MLLSNVVFIIPDLFIKIIFELKIKQIYILIHWIQLCTWLCSLAHNAMCPKLTHFIFISSHILINPIITLRTHWHVGMPLRSAEAGQTKLPAGPMVAADCGSSLVEYQVGAANLIIGTARRETSPLPMLCRNELIKSFMTPSRACPSPRSIKFMRGLVQIFCARAQRGARKNRAVPGALQSGKLF